MRRQIFAGDEELDYAFMGTDPSAPDNVWLREAAEWQIPVIYFLGVSPGRYQAIIPTFVVDWAPDRLTARIAFRELAGATAPAPNTVERRCALRLIKQRLHQASFRDSVLAAYDHCCAISNLPDDHLPDAAHIMADAHELLGQPVIANGIALSKIHHAAFDNHLIGIFGLLPYGRAFVERVPSVTPRAQRQVEAYLMDGRDQTITAEDCAPHATPAPRRSPATAASRGTSSEAGHCSDDAGVARALVPPPRPAGPKNLGRCPVPRTGRNRVLGSRPDTTRFGP